MEQAADTNCVSHENVGYCSNEPNATTLTNTNDGVDTARTTSTAADVQGGNSWDGVVPETANNSHNNDDLDMVDQGKHRAMRSIILILALSLHHLFEGVSLGLQRTVTGALMLLLALLCHETIISFSLGLQFVKSDYSRRQHYITAFACSIVEPIGVAIGRHTPYSTVALMLQACVRLLSVCRLSVTWLNGLS